MEEEGIIFWDHLERAWVLVVADSGQVEEIAACIAKMEWPSRDPERNSDRAVARADVVCGRYNIVVPVYAVEETLIDSIVCEISALSGVVEVEKLVVRVHNPCLPHEARGYVTSEEAPENPVTPGPAGYTAWG